MPRDYFVCSICKKKVYYSDGYVRRDGRQPVRLITVRRHYKAKHPGKFREMIQKGIKTKRRTRKSVFL